LKTSDTKFTEEVQGWLGTIDTQGKMSSGVVKCSLFQETSFKKNPSTRKIQPEVGIHLKHILTTAAPYN